MALQWGQRSKLELARALPWLAAFGLLEAVATWGNGFIPIQTVLLSARVIQDLRFLQLLVYLATFMTLLGFGLKLNEPAISPRLKFIIPTLGYGVVSLLLFGQYVFLPPDPSRNLVIEALFRYLLCLPSALLVAYGLRQQAYRLVGPLDVDRIVKVLRVAGYGFLLYAAVEGILVTPVSFFPGNIINSQIFYDLLGLPVGIVRAVVGAIIAFNFLRAMEVFHIEGDRVAQELEREHSLRTERERISRDLHDGTIQSIFAAGLVLDGVRRSVDDVSMAQNLPVSESELLGNARVQLDQVMTSLNKTIQGIRSYIYDLRSSTADEDLARGLVQIVSEFRNRSGLETRWTAEGRPQYTLPADQRQHVYQIVHEALSNVSRHAGATQVSVELRYDGCDTTDRAMCLRISDNGSGLLPVRGQVGHGLRNMRERARLLGASLDVKGLAGKGTVVTLELRDVENQTTVG
jgi:signal transduction histidine kinase